ncbi:MAG: terminase, partial [Gammaproteobacteria bacterium]|nr:terminase [Gammaproteobacteria bacterium]
MNEHKIFDALLRDNLNAFIRKTFETVSTGDSFADNWHLQAIAYHLKLCAQGDIRRLIITIPPRSLKSISASVAFPAWLLGHDPTRKIICVSYANDLAIKHSLDTRIVMESDWYRRCFPHAGLNPNKNTQHEFMTTKLGYRLATSVGGTLTGRGGNLIIVDDPHKSDEVESDVKRESVINWFRNTLVSRLNDKKKDVIIVIQQRLHEEDLAGHLLEKEGWTHLNLPAIAEEAESILVGKGKYHERKVGDVLHPEKEPIEALMQMEEDTGSYAFAAQYQQRPAPLGGGIVKWAWFKQRYAQRPNKQEGDYVIQSWDTASSTGQMNDYSVCTSWLTRNGQCYLLDVFRKRLEFPQLKQ